MGGNIANGAAVAINNNGIAIGMTNGYNSTGQALGSRAVKWSSSSSSELGTLGSGTTHTRVYSINDQGIAVGDATNASGGHAVRWSADGTATQLDSLGGDFNHSAVAINNEGTAVGYSLPVSPNESRATRWDAGGTNATQLGVSNAFPYEGATAINNAGHVIGWGHHRFNIGGTRAMRWDSAGQPVLLDLLGIENTTKWLSNAADINDAGTTVGWAADYQLFGVYNGRFAARWDAGGTAVTRLGNFWNGIDGKPHAGAAAINGAGTIVGSEYNNAHITTALRWSAGQTVPTVLGNLGTRSDGFWFSDAFDINAAGIAVGTADKYDALNSSLGPRAVYWSLDGNAIDLNTLIDPASGWRLTSANSISDTGWIAGYGYFDPDGPNGQAEYYRLFSMQVPLPIAGDFNHDSIVDAADYVVWRKNDGTMNLLPNDPHGGTIGSLQFNTWRTNFGNMAGSGSNANSSHASVPEPATGFSILIAAMLAIFVGKRVGVS